MTEEMKSAQESKDESERGGEQKESGSVVKNLISLLILVVGLFIGSVFIDIVQLASGQGISRQALSSSDIFEADGKTWVAFEEPMAKLTVINDEECEACDPSQAILFLRRYLPTLLAEEVSVDSEAGKRLIEESGAKTLPAFVFDSSVEDTSFYLQAEQIFSANEKGTAYALDVSQLGLPIGKYLELPEVDEQEDIIVGNIDAPLTIIEFSDFQCPYCQLLHPSINQALEEFDGQIRFVYKHLPLGFHAQAENAALASECANEQEAFLAYADTLFENQAVWGETEGTAMFKQYATQLGLNSTTFNQCLDSKKYQEKVERDMAQAQEFGVSGTPGTFIGDQFLGGAAQYDRFKSIIEEELGIEAPETLEEEVILEEVEE
jgi:protein-disulfide isomerase